MKSRSLPSKLLGRLGAAAVAAALMAGCGASSTHRTKPPPQSVATSCHPGNAAGALRVVLSDHAPIPEVAAHQGGLVEVVSRFGRQAMTFPAAHPVSAVCELARHRDRDGAATVLYRLVGSGTVTFSSTYLKATPAMMPEMLARVVVTTLGPSM